MIEIHFDERVKIGLQYALETLHGCSPFGQERIRRLRFYAPEERAELERELYNVEQAARAAEALKDTYTKVMTVLCQMKDIRTSLRRCAAGETPDHVELFEIKGYLQRLENLRPLFDEIDGVSEEVAKEALRLAQHKLPIKTKIVTRTVEKDGEEA